MIYLSDYCEKCKDEYNLPQCANYIFHAVCEICGRRKAIVYFYGGCCIIK